MSNFDRHEYFTYRRLCLQLHLQHSFYRGDWYLDTLYEAPNDLFVVTPYDEKTLNSLGDRACWVPSFSDWLEMLELTGHDDIRIWRSTLSGFVALSNTAPGTFHSIEGPTREEAVALLWIKITGTKTD